MRDRPKVGEILVQAGIIDELQLSAALGEQTRWGRRLGMTLIKLGMVQEGHLVRALAKQFDLPVASLSGKKIAPEVIALVPAKVACEHSVIPLFVKKEGHREQLFLGMEEPSDLGILDDLAFRTGMVIRPVMVGPTEIGEAIDRYYNAKPTPAPAASLPDPMRGADTLSETNLRNIQEEAGPSLSQLLKPGAGPTMTPTTTAEPTATATNVVRPGTSRGIDVTPVVFDAPPVPAAPPVAPAAPSAPAAPAVQAVSPAPAVPAAPAALAAPDAPVSTNAPITPPATAIASAPAAPAVAPAVAPSVVAAAAAAAEAAALREAQATELARVLEETERTRLVAKAIAHLLIEKGILTFDELQARIEKMKSTRVA
jgi:type IV pilus assembly protein PilB